MIFRKTSSAFFRSPSYTLAGTFGESLYSISSARSTPGNNGTFPAQAGTSTLCMSLVFRDIFWTSSNFSLPTRFLAPKALMSAALNFLESARSLACMVNFTGHLSTAPKPTNTNSVSSFALVSVWMKTAQSDTHVRSVITFPDLVVFFRSVLTALSSAIPMVPLGSSFVTFRIVGSPSGEPSSCSRSPAALAVASSIRPSFNAYRTVLHQSSPRGEPGESHLKIPALMAIRRDTPPPARKHDSRTRDHPALTPSYGRYC